MLNIETIPVGPLKTNCYVLYAKDSSDAIIIDPGDEFEKIDSFIAGNGLCPKHIILTHGHYDHIGAINQLSKKYNPQIIINSNDYSLLKNPDYNLSSNHFGKKTVVDSENIKCVDDETCFLLGYIFSFIHTPGHTLGSMCIKVKDILFTGDTLFYMSIGNEFPPFGNIKTEINSIKTKLYTLSGNYICYTGHGIATNLDFERNNNPFTGENYNGY